MSIESQQPFNEYFWEKILPRIDQLVKLYEAEYNLRLRTGKLSPVVSTCREHFARECVKGGYEYGFRRLQKFFNRMVSEVSFPCLQGVNNEIVESFYEHLRKILAECIEDHERGQKSRNITDTMYEFQRHYDQEENEVNDTSHEEQEDDDDLPPWWLDWRRHDGN